MKLYNKEVSPIQSNYFDNNEPKLMFVSDSDEIEESSVNIVVGYNSDTRKWVTKDSFGDLYEYKYAVEIPKEISLTTAVAMFNHHPKYNNPLLTHNVIVELRNWVFNLGNVFGYAIKTDSDLAYFLQEDNDYWIVSNIVMDKIEFKDVINVLTMKNKKEKIIN